MNSGRNPGRFRRCPLHAPTPCFSVGRTPPVKEEFRKRRSLEREGEGAYLSLEAAAGAALVSDLASFFVSLLDSAFGSELLLPDVDGDLPFFA